jgi:phytoene dehydrogenase-like protein
MAAPRHEVVIVGGGHDGLTCAAYLARAGLDVCVLEARDGLGGRASTVGILLDVTATPAAPAATCRS